MEASSRPKSRKKLAVFERGSPTAAAIIQEVQRERHARSFHKIMARVRRAGMAFKKIPKKMSVANRFCSTWGSPSSRLPRFAMSHDLHGFWSGRSFQKATMKSFESPKGFS